MFQKWAQDTLDPSLSRKSIKCGVQIPNLNEQLKQYFIHTFEIYEKLFTVIKHQSSFYSRPEPLRHPLIFYYGHTATFYVNKLIDSGLLKNHVNEVYERMFAVGVDENDWDDLDESHYDWPRLDQVQNYRNQVKQVILDLIRKNQQKVIKSQSPLWGLMMGIDHQKLHLETSAVIIRRLSADEVHPQSWIKQCPFSRDHPSKVPANTLETVPQTDFTYNKQMKDAEYYGWDCEFGKRRINVKQFKASKMLVSNGEYLQFYLDNGYKKQFYWTEEGWTWVTKNNIQKPVFWIVKQGDNKDILNYALKTLTQEISMPWDWPAEVNNHQARAFCNWKSKKTGKKLRLPTEDQYLAIRSLLKADYETWQYQSVGNINMEFWCSPCPVDIFQIQGFCDIVGNVFQHTMTPFFPYQNFEIHPLYEDFTTPCLDSRHDTLKGGCFINTGNSASMWYRTGFRRHFYLIAGFRYVESQNPTDIAQEAISQSDESMKQALKLHYQQKKSYIQQIIAYSNKNISQNDKRSLIVGCSVGRLPLQMTKIFQLSYGIDYTARYFQMATRLLQKGTLNYKGVNIKLQDFQITSKDIERVRLYQMNPINVDKNKINNIDWIVVDGFNLRRGTMINVLRSCFSLFRQYKEQDKKKPHALIICPMQNIQKDFENELESSLTPPYSVKVIDSFIVENINGETKQQGKVYHIEVVRQDSKK